MTCQEEKDEHFFRKFCESTSPDFRQLRQFGKQLGEGDVDLGKECRVDRTEDSKQEQFDTILPTWLYDYLIYR